MFFFVVYFLKIDTTAGPRDCPTILLNRLFEKEEKRDYVARINVQNLIQNAIDNGDIAESLISGGRGESKKMLQEKIK